MQDKPKKYLTKTEIKDMVRVEGIDYVFTQYLEGSLILDKNIKKAMRDFIYARNVLAQSISLPEQIVQVT